MGDQALAAELARRGITDERVLAAIASLDRSLFIAPEQAPLAGVDAPLPIGHGQTISQPFVVAYMTQALAPRPGERILEVGTGSGYQTAVLGRLGVEVFSIELIPELAAAARARLEGLELSAVHLRQGDGHRGWPEGAPFDAILLTAAPPRLPPALWMQLRPGGRLVAPIGAPADVQSLVRLTKGPSGEVEAERLLEVRFVPMVPEPSLPA